MPPFFHRKKFLAVGLVSPFPHEAIFVGIIVLPLLFTMSIASYAIQYLHLLNTSIIAPISHSTKHNVITEHRPGFHCLLGVLAVHCIHMMLVIFYVSVT